MRVRAPRLQGREWLNTGGVPLTLAGLRGKFVLLDFWTFACVNCLHVIEELRPLQERFAEVLVTVGVHSPKFLHEGDPQAVIDAVERYRVEHPVLDDPQLRTWDAYAAKAWPTLVLIDPVGYIVATYTGERHAGELAEVIERLSAVHEADGTLHRGPLSFTAAASPPQTAVVGAAAPSTRTVPSTFAPVPASAPASSAASTTAAITPPRLRFPGGLLVLPPERYPGGGVLVSATADQQLVILGADLSTERDRIGTGDRRSVDGGPQVAGFADPLGAALLPPPIAAQVGYDVLIADSAGNALRGLRLADLTVRTVTPELSTPWDVAWFGGQAVIAMAGVHQLWSFDPVSSTLQVFAGTGREGLVDGAAERSWFAQPSGLAVDRSAGPQEVLWVADAETSALRLLWTADDGTPQVRTVIGQGLFEFGLVDGDSAQARLQHPLGVAVLPDGTVAIADTYNGAIRRYHPATDQLSTLTTGLAEPSALVVAGADLLVAESAAHRLTWLPLPAEAGSETGPTAGTEAGAQPGPESGTVVSLDAATIRRPVIDLAPGEVRLSVLFRPPAGQKLDDRCGDPTRLDVVAVPPEVLRGGAGPATGLTRTLVTDDRVSGGRVEGRLLVSVQAVSCDAADRLGAACHLFRRRWEIPFRLVPGADPELTLVLPPA